MIQQPELGKRIAVLRAGKGMTQAELAEKCNVTVRTVQRIESAETTPRSYTVKTIFAALGEDIFAGNSFGAKKQSFSEKWADLFNLKTNTMKKLMILSSPLVLAIGIFFISQTGFAQDSKVKKAVDENNANFTSLFNAGKLDGVQSIYTKNACSTPGPTQEICGSENIRLYYEQLYASGFRFISVKSNSVTVTDSIAIDKGAWSAKVDGKPIGGTYFTQWRFENGKWKIENESSSINSGMKGE